MEVHANTVDQRFYDRIHTYLARVNSSKLDQYGRFEYSSKRKSFLDPLKSLILTIPWPYIIFQSLWTGVVVALGYFLGKDQLSDDKMEWTTLSADFWRSKLAISSSITFGVGWALFVLLGFLVSAASGRYYNAQKNIATIGYELRRVVRNLCQGYQRGAWHDKDHERFMSHLIAYPIALKMQLRHERDATQLAHICHPRDAEDILKAEHMHLHCSRVVRSYLAYADYASELSGDPEAVKRICGEGTRFLVMEMVDQLDSHAASVTTILDFQPSTGYVNHLRIYLYIWMMFLPLSLIAESGWFTFLWSVTITYFISKIFTISKALNDPFGFDLYDIKLNEIFIDIATQVLDVYAKDKVYYPNVLNKDHTTPEWLREPAPKLQHSFHPATAHSSASGSKASVRLSFLKRLFRLRSFWTIALVLIVFIAWSTGIIFLTWAVTRGDEFEAGTRWWTLYMPVTTGTTSFISVGLFLLVGFWLNDAYGRYWRGLQLWQTNIRPNIETAALHFAVLNEERTWHERDRELIFSYLAAVPYVAKMVLRGHAGPIREELARILSSEDIDTIVEAPDPLFQVFHTIHGYINAADYAQEPLCNTEVNPHTPYFGAYFTFAYNLWAAENAFDECISIKKFPIADAFSVHLRLFTAFWFALLPPAIVKFGGFTSLAFLVPIVFAVSNLLILGDELCDPFGDDPNDIPMDLFSREIADSVHRVYQESLILESVVHPKVQYDRSLFYSKEFNTTDSNDTNSPADESELSFSIIAKKVVQFFPNVPLLCMVIITVWTVGAVFVSWRLSKLWDDERNSNQRTGWQSPIDVDSSIIGSIGFALFLTLSFAASDGIARYDEAARMLYDLERHVRSIAGHVVKAWPDHTYHRFDKERLIAHLVQIPLCFRDILLDMDADQTQSGLLSSEDADKYESSVSKLDYLINTVQSYFILQDTLFLSPDKKITDLPMRNLNLSMIVMFCARFNTIRTITRRALAIKRFPLVGNYRMNLRNFIAIWLAVLPLSMTRYAGFFTILWVPLIAFGVFGMQEIAEKLVDPLGDDSIDVPVDELCNRASNAVLGVVNTSRWDCEYHIKQMDSDDDDEAEKESSKTVSSVHRLIFEDNSTVTASTAKQDMFQVSEHTKLPVDGSSEKSKPSLLSHFILSVPWWKILGSAIWTAVACVLSYVARKQKYDKTEKWWVSLISVNDSVAAFLSTATFTLLGFYVSNAYQRYYEAGSIWTEQLRDSLHSLARGFRSVITNGSLHKDDQKRIIGHILAVPIVLKEQLRGATNIEQVKKYLSHEDIGRIQCAKCMVSHCVDVIRSYHLKLQCRYLGSDYKNFAQPILCAHSLQSSVSDLEGIVSRAKYINEFAIPRGFLNLLDVLLVVWFIILPFAMTESTGWFTILWVPIITYSVLGIHSIAAEIQNPFGTDLNDFDLDAMADRIIRDVVYTSNAFSSRVDSLLIERKVPSVWSASTDNSDATGHSKEKVELDEPNAFIRIINTLKLASNVMNWWLMIIYLVWVAFAVSLNYIIYREWAPKEGTCDSIWFCSNISISPSLLNYIGFALFLLLGFQLYDAHGRYVRAIEIFNSRMTYIINMLTNRVMKGFHPSIAHDHDIERCLGHIAAFPICLTGTLRNVDYKEKLLQVLNEEDVNDILSSPHRADYCYDVIWSYSIKQGFMKLNVAECKTTGNEYALIITYARALKSVIPECVEIIRNPLPSGYVQHLRIFIAIYLLLLPFGLVESSGWVTILWTLFIAYGTYGIERWATELTDPFGYDTSDVPLERLSDSIVALVKEIFESYKNNLRNGDQLLRFSDLLITDRDFYEVEVKSKE